MKLKSSNLLSNTSNSHKKYMFSNEGINIPDPEWNFYLPLFLLVFIPLFTMTTSIVLMMQTAYDIKLIVIPIFMTCIPTFFLMPTSLLFNKNDLDARFTPLKYYFMFGPAGIGLYWITILLIR
jgi:hypothetical protein